MTSTYDEFKIKIDNALLLWKFKELSKLFESMEETYCFEEDYILYKIVFDNYLSSLDQLKSYLRSNKRVKIHDYEYKLLMGLMLDEKIKNEDLKKYLKKEIKSFEYPLSKDFYKVKKVVESPNRHYKLVLYEENIILIQDKMEKRVYEIKLPNFQKYEIIVDLKSTEEDVYIFTNAKKMHRIKFSGKHFEKVEIDFDLIAGIITEWTISQDYIMILTNLFELHLFSLEYGSKLKMIQNVKFFSPSRDQILIINNNSEVYFFRKNAIANYNKYRVYMKHKINSILKVTSGINHFGILTDENKLLVFGDNRLNQLGLGKKFKDIDHLNIEDAQYISLENILDVKFIGNSSFVRSKKKIEDQFYFEGKIKEVFRYKIEHYIFGHTKLYTNHDFRMTPYLPSYDEDRTFDLDISEIML